ncbi:hypothetical protein ZEAMMB73_Zm00001d041109 [Zea mays]|uniref:Uncharacterized protein n=1 Tax=Zea mays TaxID=4577 RepID=A0A1D6MUE3_MAIZE|nr:hypothetical protein ZEAMMB73_Zm00001d041109 [Zea mays]
MAIHRSTALRDGSTARLLQPPAASRLQQIPEAPTSDHGPRRVGEQTAQAHSSDGEQTAQAHSLRASAVRVRSCSRAG